MLGEDSGRQNWSVDLDELEGEAGVAGVWPLRPLHVDAALTACRDERAEDVHGLQLHVAVRSHVRNHVRRCAWLPNGA